MRVIQAAVKTRVSPSLHKCGEALEKRRPVQSKVTFALNLSVKASRGVGSFTAVDGNPWPEEFDEEMRSCVRDTFLRTTFVSGGEDFALQVSYPMRIRRTDEATSANERPPLASENAHTTPPSEIRPAECPAALYGSVQFGRQFEKMKPKRGWSPEREREIRTYLDNIKGIRVKPKLPILQCRCPCCIVGAQCDSASQCTEWMAQIQLQGKPPRSQGWRFMSEQPPKEYGFSQDDTHVAAYVCY